MLTIVVLNANAISNNVQKLHICFSKNVERILAHIWVVTFYVCINIIPSRTLQSAYAAMFRKA